MDPNTVEAIVGSSIGVVGGTLGLILPVASLKKKRRAGKLSENQFKKIMSIYRKFTLMTIALVALFLALLFNIETFPWRILIIVAYAALLLVITLGAKRRLGIYEVESADKV